MKKGHHQYKSIANKLWIARKCAGYPQKWVASLLGNQSLSIISEYEKGRKLPSLATALKLELIYQAPLAELFPTLYAKLRGEVAAAKECHPFLRQRDEEVQRELAQHVDASSQTDQAQSPALPAI